MADVKKINGYDIKDEVARQGLTGKQDKLTSENAGDNVTITEVEGVVKISAEAGLPEGTPDSLYGTDSEGNPLAYVAGDGIKLNRVILPEGYTEVEYIENQEDEANVKYVSSDDFSVSSNSSNPYILFFNQSTTEVHETVVSGRFVGVFRNNYMYWDIYTTDVNGVERLTYSSNDISSDSLRQYWGIIISGDAEDGDYFILERTGWDGQYINTGVKIERTTTYEYDEDESSQVTGVNVTANPTSQYESSFSGYNYVDFRAYYPDGTTDLRWGAVPSGNTYPSHAFTPEQLTNYGIAISGDIVIGNATPETTGTVVRIARVQNFDTYSIETDIKAKHVETDIKPFGAYKNGVGNGIKLASVYGGQGYISWEAGPANRSPVFTTWEHFYIANSESYPTMCDWSFGPDSGRDEWNNYGNPNSIYLFALHDSSALLSRPVAMKRFKLIKNGEVAFYGIPCKNSQNVAGMYDLVSETFMQSLGTGPFVAGPEVEYPTVSVEEQKILSTDSARVVYGYEDDEYIQLEWLQSEGQSVIDLGIKPNCSTTYEIKCKVDEFVNDGNVYYMLGCSSSNTVSADTAFGLYSYYLNGNFINLVYTDLENNLGATKTICHSDTDWHTYKITPQNVIIDGSVQTYHNSNTGAAFDINMGLFGYYTGAGSQSTWTLRPGFHGKISYLKEYNTGYNALLHDWIAVRRKSDGALGFYDTLSGTFCGNQGTKEFIPGPELKARVESIPESKYKSLNLVASGEDTNNTIDSRIHQHSNLTGTQNTVIGAGTYITASTTNSATGNTAIGCSATTEGRGTAIGTATQTVGDYGVAVGANSRAIGDSTTALGANAKAQSLYSIAVGGAATVRQGCSYSIAMGYNAFTQIGYGNIAIGWNSVSQGGSGSVALGQSSNASTDYSIAIGPGSLAQNSTQNIAIGYNTISQGGNYPSVAIGGNANAQGDRAIAIGFGARSSGTNSIMLGYGENATNNTFAVGYNQTVYTVLNSDGVVPYERLSEYAPNDGQVLTYDDNEGALVWADAASELEPATTSTLGGVIVGNGLSVTNNGTLSLYLPTASANTLGGVKVGNRLCINNGVLSANLQDKDFDELGGDPYDNTALANALNALQDNIDNGDADLQSQIDNLSSIGQFLAIWDCDTGIARYLTAGYQYPHGGYFIIGSIMTEPTLVPTYTPTGGGTIHDITVDNTTDWVFYFGPTTQTRTFVFNNNGTWEDTATGTEIEMVDLSLDWQGMPAVGDEMTLAYTAVTNYKPNGATYTGPSTTVTTDPVQISDMYFYDGTNWIYLANHARAIAVDRDLDSTSHNPVENATVTNALDDKVDKLVGANYLYGTDETGAQTQISAGNGISIAEGEISVIGDSVGVPQIANVYAKQLNSAEQATARMATEEYLGFYSDICFNLNLTKEQIIDKMDELYIGLERFKRNRVTSGLADPEDPESEEISYRDIANFKVQNDHFVHTDRKMYCYRYQNGDYSVYDPRRYTYFYSNFEYSTYQDMFDENENIYAFYGEYTNGNQASCLNTLRNIGTFQDYEDGDENWERYPDGDIEVFVNVNKDDSVANGYITLSVCRQYIVDGQKEYYWSPDWSDPMTDIYAMTTRKIPTEYTGSLEEAGIVQDLDGYEYVRRPDLNYWSFNFDDYNLSDWIEDILEPNTLHGTPWGQDSVVDSWKCYWLDYPMHPVLLQDCEVKYEGGWLRLKDAIAHGDEDNLPENLVFRYPYNSAELWLRFSAWQKRCMYNEYSGERDEYLQLCQKQALVYAWDWDIGYSVINRRAFGRQRNRYSFASENAKICEYIQFNLYSPANVSAGTKSKSTPIKKRLVINAANGSSGLRD